VEEQKQRKSWSELLDIFHVQHAHVNLTLQGPQGHYYIASVTSNLSACLVHDATGSVLGQWVGFLHKAGGSTLSHTRLS